MTEKLETKIKKFKQLLTKSQKQLQEMKKAKQLKHVLEVTTSTTIIAKKKTANGKAVFFFRP